MLLSACSKTVQWEEEVPLNNRVEFGVDNMLSRRVDLHSPALLTAGLLSDTFRQATVAVQRTLPILMDKSFYAFDAASSDQQNVLINFIRSEQGPGDKLTHFATDLNKLGTNISGMSVQAQDAIIAQGIEWYYWQGTDYAGKEFFTQSGALLQYTSAIGDGLQGAQNKAAAYAKLWLDPMAASHGAYGVGTTYEQWNVNTGTSVVTATARDVKRSQIFVGQGGAETFTGGDLGDVIMAGDWADTLSGGASNDTIYASNGNATNDSDWRVAA